MAPNDTPMPAPNAPTTTPSYAAPAIPDLSGLAAPGVNAVPGQAPSAPVPDTGSNAPDALAKMSGFVDAANAANQKAADIANTPTPNPNVPHARLLSMVQGLATGLSAFGTAIATHGKEGGAPEVAQVEGERQEQQIQAQEAAAAQKNQQIQQQLMVSSTNMNMANNVHLMATMPAEMTKADLANQEAKLGIAGEQQRQNITGADFQASHGGYTPEAFSAVLGSDAPASTLTGPASFFKSNAQQQLQASTKVLGANDPYVQGLQKTLSDPNATPKDLWTATSQLAAQQEKQSAANKEQAERQTVDANSPVAKLSTPEALAQPGVQAAIQAKIADPNTDPNDIPRLRALLPQAAVAQFNAENIKQREARNAQALSQGDPDQAGQLLANRSLTLDELKSRQVTPQFIASAILAAQKYDPNFKAAESSAQSKIAASPANQQFFGNTDSLLVRGGTLDQLASAGAALGNGKLPALNTVDNWRKAALGQGPQAAYAAAALGVADDYSKVMSGGTGSDTSRLQALNIIAANQSPAARAAAINQIRQAVDSQRQGRVGTNPYLTDMYPDPSVTRSATPQVGQAHPVIINGQQVGVTRDGGKTMTAN